MIFAALGFVEQDALENAWRERASTSRLGTSRTTGVFAGARAVSTTRPGATIRPQRRRPRSTRRRDAIENEGLRHRATAEPGSGGTSYILGAFSLWPSTLTLGRFLDKPLDNNKRQRADALLAPYMLFSPDAVASASCGPCR